jgi:hypothetical protein
VGFSEGYAGSHRRIVHACEPSLRLIRPPPSPAGWAPALRRSSRPCSVLCKLRPSKDMARRQRRQLRACGASECSFCGWNRHSHRNKPVVGSQDQASNSRRPPRCPLHQRPRHFAPACFPLFFVSDFCQATRVNGTTLARSTASRASPARKATVLSTRFRVGATLISTLVSCSPRDQGLGASYLGVAETAIQVTLTGHLNQIRVSQQALRSDSSAVSTRVAVARALVSSRLSFHSSSVCGLRKFAR